MSLWLGCVPVVFHERDLVARIPSCVPIVAAVMAAGWRLSNDGFPNHTDVLEGVAHVQDFKRASPSKLSRVITFRFRTQRIACEGDLMRIEEFVARCQSEPAFLRAAKALPRYEHWIRQLCAKLPEVPRSLQASEPDAHDRTLVVPMHGGPIG